MVNPAPIRHFVICLRNQGHEASLEPRKLYELLERKSVGGRSFLRIIDESGEDYLYPQEYFARIELSSEVEEALALAG